MLPMRGSVGPYRIIERLGAGGMAEVFLAERRGPAGFAKSCVVKSIHPHLCADPELLALFETEARIAAGLDHPNVVHVYDFGVAGKRPYLAMEHARFGSLREALSRGLRPMPPEAVAHLGAEAARGLGFAHRQGVVHRDVSPENILLSPPAEVKVADFGIARLHGRVAETTGGKVRGKREYMAPEQARGEAVDGRADLYALGLVLWESLAQVTPARALRAGVAVAPSSLRPEVPVALDRAIVRALAEEPAQRFATAEEMEGALREVAGARGESALAEFLEEASRAAPRRTADLPGAVVEEGRRLRARIVGGLVAMAVVAVVGVALVLVADPGVVPAPVPVPVPVPVSGAVPVPVPAPGAVPSRLPAAPPAPDHPPVAAPAASTIAPGATTAAPAPAPLGYLGVQVKPWAQVYVDGERIHDTPLTRHPLPAGPHRVRLVAPDGRSRELEVNVVPGQESRVLEDVASWP